MIVLQVVVAQAALPGMTVPYTNPVVNRPLPAIYHQLRAPQSQPFAPYVAEAPPVEHSTRAQYTPVYFGVSEKTYGPKKLARPAKAARAKLEYDKSRTPGSDTYVRKEEDTNTYGRYGVAAKEVPERMEGAKYGSGYGPKSKPLRKSTDGIKLDVESADEDSDSVVTSAVAMLLGIVVGSSITYIVARPRYVSKKMGSPEPLLVASA